MRISGLGWQRFRVQLRSPFRTAHGTMAARDGLVLQLTADDGVEGTGEATPLVEFGGGTVDDCLAALEAAAPGLIGAPLAGLALCLDDLAGRPVPPALRCGLEAAALDAIGRARGRPIAALFADSPRRRVAVNGTIGGLPAEAAAAAARRLVAQGFGTIKLKVGVAGSIAEEAARVATVRAAMDAEAERGGATSGSAAASAGRHAPGSRSQLDRSGAGSPTNVTAPSPRLRLDANGAWSFAEAQRALEALADRGIELVEQPVAADDLDGLVRVRRASPIPIAADEAVVDLEAARRLIDAGAVDYLIVKPTVVGGIPAGRAIADLANPAGVGVIVTTAFEAGLGVAAALQLAATLPESAPACGLATADALASTFVRGLPPVDHGAIDLPDAPGLGVALDEDALRVHSSPPGRGWAKPR